MKAFNEIVCVGVPTHHASNLMYQSKTGLTQEKLVDDFIKTLLFKLHITYFKMGRNQTTHFI